jgi:hypothetical protein
MKNAPANEVQQEDNLSHIAWTTYVQSGGGSVEARQAKSHEETVSLGIGASDQPIKGGRDIVKNIARR